MSTLLESVPYEFMREHCEPIHEPLLNIEVKNEWLPGGKPWPGRQKNVKVWWELQNGYGVAWNENPATGWSFPVVKL
jgi:hypothetical protein